MKAHIDLNLKYLPVRDIANGDMRFTLAEKKPLAFTFEGLHLLDDVHSTLIIKHNGEELARLDKNTTRGYFEGLSNRQKAGVFLLTSYVLVPLQDAMEHSEEAKINAGKRAEKLFGAEVTVDRRVTGETELSEEKTKWFEAFGKNA